MFLSYQSNNSTVALSKRVVLASIVSLLLGWLNPILLPVHEAQAADAPVPIEVVLSSPGSISSSAAAASRLPSWKGINGNGIKSRRVEISPAVMQRGRFNKDEKLSLQLFDDTQINANVDTSSTNINGTTVTTAKIEGSDWGRVFIASTGETVRVKIHVPEQRKFYAIQRNSSDNAHYALELDPARTQFDGEGIAPPAEPGTQRDAQWRLPVIAEDESTDATAVVDIMVVYSNDALSDAGGAAEVNNLIALGMAFGNDAHSNTGSEVLLNLVHSQQINYDGSNSRSTDLSRLRGTSDGYMDDVHSLRDTYGADFVVLMVGDYSSDGGIAYVLGTTSGSAPYAFSVVTLPAFDSYTPVHEIGHNMGLSHAKDQNYQAGPTNWYADGYGFGDTTAGWHWHPTPGENGYCSVMTYTGGSYFADGLAHTRVGLFSDPDISDHELPSGHASNGYSALVLRTLKNVYAGYRDRPISSNTITIDYPIGGETFTAGSTYDLLWDSNGITGNVRIDLYNNGSFDRTISASTLNDRTFAWTIPSDVSGDNFKIRISNITETITGESSSGFSVNSVFYDEPLNSSPGYTTTGGWEFGAPVAVNNATYAGPADAYTDTNIYDTNLDGASFSTYYLTSTPIDCSNYSDIQLSFMGWFSMHTAFTARVEVSYDNSTWHQLYEKAGSFAESAWSKRTYDISTYADGQATVYIRWTHQYVGGLLSNYSGMSVDDIQLMGIENATQVTFTSGSAFTVSSPDAQTTNNAVGRFHLQAADTGVSLAGLDVNASGSRQGVDNFKLWQSADNSFNPASDTLLDTTSDGSALSFSGFSSSVSTSDTYYFVTADLALNASGTIDLSIETNSNLDLYSGTVSTPFTDAALSSAAIAINAVNEINIKGSGVTIADGDNTPAVADHTDFGNIKAASGSLIRTFTIENLGGASLLLTDSSPYVSISGHTTDFTLTQIPGDTISSGSNTTFKITFDPTAIGLRSAAVSIANDDSDENPYTFSIQGTGTTSPEINVKGNGTNISDGDSTPSSSNHTEFGSIAAASGSILHTFTIENLGTATLSLTDPSPYVSISGHTADFALTSIPANSIATGGGFTTFQITFNPTAVGLRSATISIANNDDNETPYSFNIQGTGLATPEMDVSGNSSSISDGDNTPSVADNTDFGIVDILFGDKTNTFTISNTGTATLNLTDPSPYVSISGHDADFTLSALPSSSIPANNGTTTFQITFNPVNTGVRQITVTIANNDSDENSYSFAVKGTGDAIPEIELSGNATIIPDGDTNPSMADDTDFSIRSITSATSSHTFTIENQGSEPLLLLAPSPYVAITGEASDFSLTSLPAATISAAGGTTTFEITFNPTSTGLRTATVSLASNDADENPYTFSIQGTGIDTPSVSTGSAGSITPKSAMLVGELADLGYPGPSAYGFVWNTDGGPDLSDNVVNLGSTSVTGSFSYNLNNLTHSTTIYFKAFASNTAGTVYGNSVEFTTAKKSTICFPVRNNAGGFTMICF